LRAKHLHDGYRRSRSSSTALLLVASTALLLGRLPEINQREVVGWMCRGSTRLTVVAAGLMWRRRWCRDATLGCSSARR
jgi:hypothetical protein